MLQYLTINPSSTKLNIYFAYTTIPANINTPQLNQSNINSTTKAYPLHSEYKASTKLEQSMNYYSVPMDQQRHLSL
jgi:hypothetical protein